VPDRRPPRPLRGGSRPALAEARARAAGAARRGLRRRRRGRLLLHGGAGRSAPHPPQAGRRRGAPGGELGRGAEPAPARRGRVPNRGVGATGEAAVRGLAVLAPVAAEKVAIGGQATAYVCEAMRCDLPTADPAVLAAQLRKTAPLPLALGRGLTSAGPARSL